MVDSEYGRRFWALETLAEERMVVRLLRRRFPQVFEGLAKIFEEVDPLDIVYPGNPDEYSDVVQEIIVLLAPVEGKIALLSSGQIEALVREGLSRCFDDEPVEGAQIRAAGRDSPGVAPCGSRNRIYPVLPAFPRTPARPL
jgi:hypothetical protein